MSYCSRESEHWDYAGAASEFQGDRGACPDAIWEGMKMKHAGWEAELGGPWSVDQSSEAVAVLNSINDPVLVRFRKPGRAK